MTTLQTVKPAFRWVPEDAAGDYADLAAELSAGYGVPLDPEQVDALKVMTAFRDGGKWAALETCIVEGRQNGKTDGPMLAAVMADFFLFDADEIMWTAHLFKTSRKSFEAVKRALEFDAELGRRVKRVNESHGEESVELFTGAKLSFHARSGKSGRGLGGKKIVMDEALFVDGSMMGALLPTLSARSVTGNPQIIYGSSAGVAESEHLRSLRDRGRAGNDPTLSYIEFCAPGGWDDPGCLDPLCDHRIGNLGCTLDNEDYWALANPALERRISLPYVRNERRALPVSEFGRERLGWWDLPANSATAIPLDVWRSHADAKSAMDGEPTFAFDVSPERQMAAIAVAGSAPSGVQVEITTEQLVGVDHRLGTQWLPGRLVMLARRYDVSKVYACGKAAESMRTDLEAGGLEVVVLSGAETAGACGMFFDRATAGDLVHLGQSELETALKAAAVRVTDDGWTWGRRKSTADISPLVAATVATWAHLSRAHTSFFMTVR